MDSFANSAPSVPISRIATTKCEKASSPSGGRAAKRRNRAAISLAMSKAAGVPPTSQEAQPRIATSHHKQHDVPGLTLRELEDCRWCISPSIAQKKLLHAGLPYEGRRAGLIYSWASIFWAEGIDAEFAKNVTFEERPDLFEGLLDTAGAAELLGYQDPSSIRKLVASGQIGPDAYLTFGRRGVYRFRRGALEPLRKTSIIGRIV